MTVSKFDDLPNSLIPRSHTYFDHNNIFFCIQLILKFQPDRLLAQLYCWSNLWYLVWSSHGWQDPHSSCWAPWIHIYHIIKDYKVCKKYTEKMKTWTNFKIKQIPKGSRRIQKDSGGPRRSRKVQEGPGRTQKDLEEPRRTQKDPEGPRRNQKD